MKIYVAGKCGDRLRVVEVMEKLKSLGHEITCDWTKHELHENDWRDAVEDIEGVQNCDLLIAIMIDTFNYKGVWAEIGAALALDKRVIVVGNGHGGAVFLSHPNILTVRDLDMVYDFAPAWADRG